MLDCNLSMKEQIDRTVRVASYHLRSINFVKKYTDESSLRKLISNHVISRLDYCNSLYNGLPNQLLRKLQHVLNRAVRLIKGTAPCDRITPLLIQLHWLPIKARITFKICVMVYQVIKHGKTDYTRKLLVDFQPGTVVIFRRSDVPFMLEEQRCNLQLGFRAFKISAPRLYNHLPKYIKECSNVETFKKRLKTYLFGKCYTSEMTISDNYKDQSMN